MFDCFFCKKNSLLKVYFEIILCYIHTHRKYHKNRKQLFKLLSKEQLLLKKKKLKLIFKELLLFFTRFYTVINWTFEIFQSIIVRIDLEI